MKTLFKVGALFAAIVFFVFSIYFSYLGPVSREPQTITFIIPQNKSSFVLENDLYNQKLIKNKKVFNYIYKNFFNNQELKPGGYRINGPLDTLQVIKRLTNDPDMYWVNIYYCPRKEQVGEKLASTLGWSTQELEEWNNLFKNTDYFEGVYYPDTYLIPKNEPVKDIAQRFINRFNDKIDPLRSQYLDKDIKWTTGLKIASLIAREAAGNEDAKIISGIIWNRLNSDMRLQIDATMQYTLGKNESGSWWGAIDIDEKRRDSPYNSYLYKGLPPTPICSPNIDYIEAALYPEETDCIFYLHDSNRQIHCSKTYEEHKENIRKFL